MTWQFALAVATQDGERSAKTKFATFESDSTIGATATALRMVADHAEQAAKASPNPLGMALNFTIEREDEDADPSDNWIVEGSIRQGELLGKEVPIPVGTMELIASLVDASARDAYGTHERLVEHATDGRMRAVAVMLRLANAIESQQERFAQAGISIGTVEVESAMEIARDEIEFAQREFGERLSLHPLVQLIGGEDEPPTGDPLTSS